MRILIGFIVALAVAGCETVATTKPGVVGIERQQAMLVSEKEINQAAAEQYAKTMAAARQKGILNRNPQQVQRVRTITNRLIAQTGAFRADAPRWAWEVNVIDDPQLNAWAMPGGKMAIYSGLIEKLQLTDDEIAAIMGHEIAHSLREHARERISREMATGLGVGVVGAALGLGQVGQELASMVAQVTFTLPHSRSHETEADRIGVELAARGGYDPRAAVTLWEKMMKARAAGGGLPEFLSTHPAAQGRLADLRTYAERVMPLYAGARR
jgi:predicted Zn-dependent protease